MTTTDIRIDVWPDQYVEHFNTEDGPSERLCTVYYIGAEASDGRRWALFSHTSCVVFSDEAEAREELGNVVLGPLDDQAAWRETDPVYGSEAWGAENDYELACFEADCFNEPRPRWF